MAVNGRPTKFAPDDWKTANSLTASSAERQRAAAHTIRQENQRISNDTENVTRWTQHGTDNSLKERASHIQTWRLSLTKTLQDTEDEITSLTECKERCERALEAKKMPQEVVMECLAIREQRANIDLVADVTESELQKELEVIVNLQGALHQKVNEAFDQICILREVQIQLSADLSDKNVSLEIDSECAELSNTSTTIAFHSDPTRIKKGIINPEQWEAFSTANTRRAEQEIATSTRLRQAINHTIKQTTSVLEAQWTATSYALRKRLHEMEQAKQELGWQKENTEAEIAETEEAIASLSQALADKTPPLMVANTRLENRTHRPRVELCRDPPMYGMVEEVAEIAGTQHSLGEKLTTAQQGLGTLQRTLERIQRDLESKTACVALDKDCMEVRKRLGEHPKAEDLLKPRDL
jgi:tektin-2